MIRTLFPLLALAALLTACNEKPTEVTSREPTQRPAATLAAPPAPPAPVIRDQDIPTLADFEEEAEKDITPANMEAELARIEKDLTTSPGQQEGALSPR